MGPLDHPCFRTVRLGLDVLNSNIHVPPKCSFCFRVNSFQANPTALEHEVFGLVDVQCRFEVQPHATLHHLEDLFQETEGWKYPNITYPKSRVTTSSLEAL